MLQGFTCSTNDPNQGDIAGLRIVGGNQNIIDGNTLQQNWRGLIIDNGANNTIGGTVEQAGNFIRRNDVDGIKIFGAQATENTIQNNRVTANKDTGIEIGERFRDSKADNDAQRNRIIANIIQGNGRNGISLSNNTRRTRISQNIILNNYNATTKVNGLGIDLDSISGRNPRVRPNDPDGTDADTGANDWQNFPVLNMATTSASDTTIQGILTSTPNTTYTIEFFSNANCDPSNYGEGEVFVGTTTVTTSTNGTAPINHQLIPLIPVGRWVTATATDPAGNTSEFSKCLQVTQDSTRANLAITMQVIPSTVYAGKPLTFQTTVTNVGQTDATNVALSYEFLIPDGDYQVLTGTTNAPGGTCTLNETGACALGTMKPGASVNVTTVIIPTIATESAIPQSAIQVTAIVSVSSNETDTTPQDNQATATATVLAAADLSIAQTVTPPVAAAREAVTYTVTLTNNGPSTAANATATFSVPTQLTKVSCSAPAGWACTEAGNNWIVTASFFPPGQVTVTVSGTLGCLAQNATLTNIASLTATSLSPNSPATFDPNLTNNTSTVNSSAQAGTAVAKVAYNAGGTLLPFGPIVAGGNALPSGSFVLENTGCLPMKLTQAEIMRTSNTANLSRLDDSLNYKIYVREENKAEQPIARSERSDRSGYFDLTQLNLMVEGGKQLQGRVEFAAPLPFFANGFARSGLGVFASSVLPEQLTSQLLINFTALSGTTPVGVPGIGAVSLAGRVVTAVQIIPRDGLALPPPTVNSFASPEASPLVIMENIRGEFRVAVSLYDANLNVTQLVYQFYDTYGQPASSPLTVDVAEAIRQSGLLAGQPFTLLQSFTGAAARPDITRVQVMVKDADGSTATASSANVLSLIGISATWETQPSFSSGVVHLPAQRLLEKIRAKQLKSGR